MAELTIFQVLPDLWISLVRTMYLLKSSSIRAKVAANNAMPGWVVLFVEFLQSIRWSCWVPRPKPTATMDSKQSFLMKAAMSFSILYFSKAWCYENREKKEHLFQRTMLVHTIPADFPNQTKKTPFLTLHCTLLQHISPTFGGPGNPRRGSCMHIHHPKSYVPEMNLVQVLLYTLSFANNPAFHGNYCPLLDIVDVLHQCQRNILTWYEWFVPQSVEVAANSSGW